MPPKMNRQSDRSDHEKETVEKETSQETPNRTEKKRTREKERVQFDFTIDALVRLDELKDQTEASTRAEVIRQALRLYEWFISDIEPNHTITVTDTTGNIVTTFKAKLLHSAMKSE